APVRLLAEDNPKRGGGDRFCLPRLPGTVLACKLHRFNDQHRRQGARQSRREDIGMTSHQRTLTVAGALALYLAVGGPASAQKSGGILKISHFDSPASMSMHEEATAAVNRPMMGVFNNLVIYKQDVPQASIDSIVPELATGWTWSEDGAELT